MTTSMQRETSKLAHAVRLRNLTDDQIVNLMQHADNETPLLPCFGMNRDYIDHLNRC